MGSDPFNANDPWAASLDDLPEHARAVIAELANEEPSAEVLAMDDRTDVAELPHACSDFEVRRG